MGRRKNENKPEGPIWPADKNPQALTTSPWLMRQIFPICIPFQQADFCGLFWWKKSKEESFLHLPSNKDVCFLTCLQNHIYISSAAFYFIFLWQFLSSLEFRKSECCWKTPELLQPCLLLLCWSINLGLLSPNKVSSFFSQQSFKFYRQISDVS